LKKSIYAQLVLIFIVIIFLGNLSSSVIGSTTIESGLMEEISKSLNGVLSAANETYERHQLSAADIEKMYASGFIAVKYYGSSEELMEDYDLTAESLEAVEAKPAAFRGKSKGQLNLKIPISVVKSGDGYMVAVLQGNNAFTDFRRIILNYSLLSILCGAVVMLLAARFIVKPIKKLTWATEQIAKGNFKVFIKKNRKDEIGQLIDNFNKMAKELAGMELLRSSFIADIAHEFKTPLTSIEGYTKLLRNCKSDEERNEYMDIIIEETRRLSALSGNILLLNRIENENITLIRAPFRLDEQIRHVILLCESKWSSKNMDLNIDLDEVVYTGNEQLLFQVWLNLVDNAVKFSKPHETIQISLRRAGDRISFSITDYGCGMREEQQKRIFEKFYMGDKSRNTEGNGLGLSIVKRIVDMHGGTIEVQSRPDEFTIIKVTL
jgi:signal transduction histidine kinase